jgi:exopolyphosphatase/pppGpp-phosphohydrolase
LCAATLHDIGVHTEGTQGHHKTALHIILSTPLLHFSSQERLMIGSIARYHRKALPSGHHSHFAALSKPAQKLVVPLSAILRVADGLDYSHKARVQKVKIKVSEKKITFLCASKYHIEKEITSAVHKSDLMQSTFNRKVIFKEN